MEGIYQGILMFQQGGIVMYVLLLCSLVVVYFAVERGLYFRRMDAGSDFAERCSHVLRQGDADQAAACIAQGHGALAAILQAVLSGKAGAKPAAYMEMESGIAIARFRQHLYFLSVIVTMAPLLGLLGTISGMIRSFSIFNIESGQAVAITGGVGEALIATAFGLCVAVLALAVHAYFTQRLERIITDMETCFSAWEVGQES